MATSGRCPRCDCEGNQLGCEMCYYYGFKCPGNCACCADQKVPAVRKQARMGFSNGQRALAQKAMVANNRNVQKQPVKKQKRAPFRPLILRNVKKSMVESQRKANSNASQIKAENPTVCENTKKVNSTVAKSNENKVKSSKFQIPVISKVDAETQTSDLEEEVASSEKEVTSPQEEVTGPQEEATSPEEEGKAIVEPALIRSYNEFIRKDNERKRRLFNKLLWPQWDKVPCEPYVSQKIEDHRRRRDCISKEKLDESVDKLIGNHCLNCHCKNPRDSCDICKRTDYQCLGTCLCCTSFRGSQRYMIFVTRGLYKLSDGSIYGGGNVHMS